MLKKSKENSLELCCYNKLYLPGASLQCKTSKSRTKMYMVTDNLVMENYGHMSVAKRHSFTLGIHYLINHKMQTFDQL